MNKQSTENVPGYNPPYGFTAKGSAYVNGEMSFIPPSYIGLAATGFPTNECLPSDSGSHTGYGPTSSPGNCLPMLIDHNSNIHGISNHQVLVRVAEGWMQTFYTMLSTDPATVTSLYLNDAQAIYTGQEINMDAELMTGITEIAAFFSSPSAAKFHHMRVIVDALHPLSYPGVPQSYHAKESNGTDFAKNPFTCVTLFIRGRVWLHTSGNRFLHSPFYHNLLLYLIPGAAVGSYRVANEHFHLNQLPLSARPIPPIIYQTASGAFPATAAAYFATAPTPPEIPPLAQPPPMINCNTTTQDKPAPEDEASHPPIEDQKDLQPAKQVSPSQEPVSNNSLPAKPKRIQTGEASVHAYPETDGLSQLADSELIKHLNTAFADACVPLDQPTDEHIDYVASVIRVLTGFPAKKKSWFFVNLANVAVRNAVLNRGSFPVNGIQVRFSTIRQTRTNKSYTSKGSGDIPPRVRTASRDAGYSDKSSIDKRTDAQAKQRAFHANKVLSTGTDKKPTNEEVKGNSSSLVVRCNKPPRVVSLTTSSNTSASHFRRFHNRGSLLRNNFKTKPAEEQ